MTLFIVAIATAVLPFIFLFQGLVSLGWPTTQATVVDSGPPVKFEYEVIADGRTYRLRGEGEKYSLIISSKESCRARYPVGRRITIHHDFYDENAHESTIVAGPGWDVVVIIILAACVAVYAWRRFKATNPAMA
jgi:hypothetical protein